VADISLDDARSTDPVERLLEDSWRERARAGHARELFVEALAGVLLLAIAVPLVLSAMAAHDVDWGLAALLVAMYALTSRMVKFPIGAGYVVPSYLVLVPMLLLLPPGLVLLLTAVGLVAGTAGLALARRVPPERIFLAIPDAWHVLGPVAVLLILGRNGSAGQLAVIYLVAFVAGCAFDLASGAVRELAISGVASHVQLRVQAKVWMIDACIAPLGLVVAHAMRQQPLEGLLILPFCFVLLMVSRDRSARIEQAQQRLELVAHERTRLQTAVGRLGEALAAKLDLHALADIVLRGSVEALDASCGMLALSGVDDAPVVEIGDLEGAEEALATAAGEAQALGKDRQVERGGVWALALPFGFATDTGETLGAVTVARTGRPFREDERMVMQGLVDRARAAAADIVTHQQLREQAFTDALTKLGNRRKLMADTDDLITHATAADPLVLMLFDLNGFKAYNDTFGHQAGDAVLARVGSRLATAVGRYGGSAYRLGGDEFCAVLAIEEGEIDQALAAASAGLEEHGENFSVTPSMGAVMIPHEATTLEQALQVADERMYSHKRKRTSLAGDQAREVLLRIIHAKQPALQERSSDVAQMCERVGRRMGLDTPVLEELVRAAELHDVGKVGIPDAILRKTEPLTEAEWAFVKQHTLLGARILGAVPALAETANIVRATHERWDGEGYPDGLRGEDIPIAARIISACDAYEAMREGRSYRTSRSATDAVTELRRGAGSQFDPAVIAALVLELNDPTAEVETTETAPVALRAEQVSRQLRDAFSGEGGVSLANLP
jgi:diguanylate cyclase (GGDEF)-like protein